MERPQRAGAHAQGRHSTDQCGCLESHPLPEFAEHLKAEGSDPVGDSPEQLAAFLREETAKWNKVIQFANIKGLQ